MKFSNDVRAPLFVASNLFLLSYQALKYYEPGGNCEMGFLDLSPRPVPWFDSWGELGLTLGVMALGLLIGAISFARDDGKAVSRAGTRE